MKDVIPVNDYDGIKLDEYNGKYSLLFCRVKKDGSYESQWAKYSKRKGDYQDKDWPIKVPLGDKKTAIGALEMILSYLRGEKSLSKDDVPF